MRADASNKPATDVAMERRYAPDAAAQLDALRLLLRAPQPRSCASSSTNEEGPPSLEDDPMDPAASAAPADQAEATPATQS